MLLRRTLKRWKDDVRTNGTLNQKRAYNQSLRTLRGGNAFPVSPEVCQQSRARVDLNEVSLVDRKFLYEGNEMELVPISRGSNGVVVRAYDDKGVEFAVKIISPPEKPESNEQDLKKYEQELKDYEQELKNERKAFEVLNELGCPNVVHGRPIKDGLLGFFLMQLLDGDMQQLALRLPLNVVKDVCRSLANVLNCLWQSKIVYTDIKPANLLFRCTGPGTFDVVLADLGDVLMLNDNNKKIDFYSETFPYPFPNERMDTPTFGIFEEYKDLIGPLTMENAEHHMVWGVAAFFFVMMQGPDAVSVLTWKRNFTNEEFLNRRQRLVDSTEGAGIFGEALIDPDSFELKDFLDSSPSTPETLPHHTPPPMVSPPKIKRKDNLRKKKRIPSVYLSPPWTHWNDLGNN